MPMHSEWLHGHAPRCILMSDCFYLARHNNSIALRVILVKFVPSPSPSIIGCIAPIRRNPDANTLAYWYWYREQPERIHHECCDTNTDERNDDEQKKSVAGKVSFPRQVPPRHFIV